MSKPMERASPSKRLSLPQRASGRRARARVWLARRSRNRRKAELSTRATSCRPPQQPDGWPVDRISSEAVVCRSDTAATTRDRERLAASHEGAARWPLRLIRLRWLHTECGRGPRRRASTAPGIPSPPELVPRAGLRRRAESMTIISAAPWGLSSETAFARHYAAFGFSRTCVLRERDSRPADRPRQVAGIGRQRSGRSARSRARRSRAKAIAPPIRGSQNRMTR
jgi:hypothetical protein